MQRRVNWVVLVYLFIGPLAAFWLGGQSQSWLNRRELEYRPVVAR
jgi:hypothetical protein